MDTRTGELWTPSLVESARKKAERGAIDELTATERRFILAEHFGMVAWISPEVAEQVRRGQAEFEREATENFLR